MGGDLWLVWELDGGGWGGGYILVRAGNKMGGCLDGRTFCSLARMKAFSRRNARMTESPPYHLGASRCKSQLSVPTADIDTLISWPQTRTNARTHARTYQCLREVGVDGRAADGVEALQLPRHGAEVVHRRDVHLFLWVL